MDSSIFFLDIPLAEVLRTILQGLKASTHSSITLFTENCVSLSFGLDLIWPWNANDMRS
jgi:hypothetical protein